MGLAWNLLGLPRRVRSPQPRAAIRVKILNIPFLGHRSEAGMGGGGVQGPGTPEAIADPAG